ncbi:hypothetical protein TrCOL_g4235, partial [Triparma columacea]
MEADLMRAEAAAALARGVMGVENEEGGGGGMLMNFGIVMEEGDREEGIAATKETIEEISRIRGEGGKWDGGEGGGGRWIRGGGVKWVGKGVEVKKKKRERLEIDAVKDNMATFFNPYAKDRDKSKEVDYVGGIGEGVEVEVILTNLLAAPVDIKGCRVVVSGVPVTSIERDVTLRGGERGTYRFMIHLKEEGGGRITGLEGILWRRAVKVEVEEKGLRVVGKVPRLRGGVEKLEAKVATGEVLTMEKVWWEGKGVEAIKVQVDGVAGYEGGVGGGEFRRERDGVGVKVEGGSEGVGMQVTLFPPTVGNGE